MKERRKQEKIRKRKKIKKIKYEVKMKDMFVIVVLVKQ